MSRTRTGTHPMIPRFIRMFSVPIVLGWLAITVVLNVIVPQLEKVGEENAVSSAPNDAPSLQAMQRIGKVFSEFDSNSSAMIVLEGDQPLGDAAHEYYDSLIDELEADEHVEHIEDFWGDPLTAAGAQSADGKAAYVQLYLAGDLGARLSNDAVRAVRDIVANSSPPPGINTYVTGPAPLVTDQIHAGGESLKVITVITMGAIFVMLLFVYRSIVTVLLVLAIMFTELSAVRGVVATLGHYQLIGLSTFAVNLLTTLAIAAGTDYAIFLVGRYHEARQNGEDRETAFYTMYRGTAHVILGSGLTIAGATFCLYFTRLPPFETMAIPLAIGMLVAVAAALTLAPAVLAIASRFGLFDPKRNMNTRGWRRIGTAVVRWPGPVLAASVALTLIGLLALPTYQPAFTDRLFLPSDEPSNLGYAAADRHFPQARLNPEILLIETDHDVRNSTDMLVIDRITKSIFNTRGIGRVQSITRPQGTPIEHTSIPFLIGMQGTIAQMNQDYVDNVMANVLKQVDGLQTSIDSMTRMQRIASQMAVATNTLVAKAKSMTVDIQEVRDHVADFDDLFRPLRNYFYGEPHCYNIPVCWSIRSVFETLDSINTMTDDVQSLLPELERLNALIPEIAELLPSMIETLTTVQQTTQAMYQSQKSQQDQLKALQENSTAIGQAFDASKNDDSFYLPPEVFENPAFKRGLEMFVSPDGKAVRFIIAHEGDPSTVEGIDLVPQVKEAAFDAIKGTPWEGSRIFIAGTASTYKDMKEGSQWDLLSAGTASLCLIFTIMLLLTRALIAATVIVGTVLLSLGAAFGLSVLIWQNIAGIQLQWMISSMSIIILLAVGSDYNLLLVSRFKEEVHAGIKTGIIRSMAGTGAVVTSAGVVFAFTMISMLVSDLTIVGQIGTTIGIGLLLDTLIIRSFMMPSIAAMMGRWFWWPQNVRTRPKPVPWPVG